MESKRPQSRFASHTVLPDRRHTFGLRRRAKTEYMQHTMLRPPTPTPKTSDVSLVVSPPTPLSVDSNSIELTMLDCEEMRNGRQGTSELWGRTGARVPSNRSSVHILGLSGVNLGWKKKRKFKYSRSYLRRRFRSARGPLGDSLRRDFSAIRIR